MDHGEWFLNVFKFHIINQKKILHSYLHFFLSPIKANALHFFVKAALCFVVSHWSSPLLYSSRLLCVISNSPIQIVSMWVWVFLIHKFFLLINEIYITVAFPEWKNRVLFPNKLVLPKTSFAVQTLNRPICVQCGDTPVRSDGSLCTDNAIMAS